MNSLRTIRVVFLSLLPLAFGCGDPARDPPAADPPAPIASQFDPQTAGIIRGRVTWTGDVPLVPPFFVLSEESKAKTYMPNANAPVVDAATRGVANAVVFLRGVEPHKARPWDHAPLAVEQRWQRFHVLQGGIDSYIGFVERGQTVAMVSHDPFFHSLHAGGATFFTLTFPDPNRPRRRLLDKTGIVELSSAAGYFWMRAFLFVDDHPYYTRTDSQGRFSLKQVPAGRYEVVCWLPNWKEAGHSRDPETGLITRMKFGPVMEQSKDVVLEPRGDVDVSFAVSTAAFR